MLAEARTGGGNGFAQWFVSKHRHAQISPVMREGPGLLFGRSEDIVESMQDAISKITRRSQGASHDEQSEELQGVGENQFAETFTLPSCPETVSPT